MKEEFLDYVEDIVEAMDDAQSFVTTAAPYVKGARRDFQDLLGVHFGTATGPAWAPGY